MFVSCYVKVGTDVESLETYGLATGGVINIYKYIFWLAVCFDLTLPLTKMSVTVFI